DEQFGLYGGGMRLIDSNPILAHVTITHNTAGSYGGGGMNLWSSNPILTNVTIAHNNTEGHGGGMNIGVFQSVSDKG
ncbi:MAG: hypothetical protein QF541_19685, partial [Lentisphaeria bacterium]|nr:hypothetical protein [Lentisphaeria bacterium]